MIIGLIGNTRVGKDTIADYLVDNYEFTKFSFANQIKNVAREIFGWNEEQLDGHKKDIPDKTTGIIPREFFKWMGTDVMQYDFHDKFALCNILNRSIWAYSLLNSIQQYIDRNENIVITDFRFMHEFNLFKDFANIKFYVVSRENYNKNGISTVINDVWQYEILDILKTLFRENYNFDFVNNNLSITKLNINLDEKMEKLNINKYISNIDLYNAYYG